MVGNPDFLTGAEAEKEQAPAFEELQNPEGELHLRFYIPSGSELALNAIGIREVLSQSPDMITAIPNVSPLLLGTINIRGRVIWVADLGKFLGDEEPLNTDRSDIPVIAVEDQDTMLGLAVDRIVGMVWLDVEELQRPRDVPDTMEPFLKGEWLIDKENGKYLWLLNQVALLRSARWAA